MLSNKFAALTTLKRGLAFRKAVNGGSGSNGRTSFDRNMPQIRRKKAWERDGEDKESWFKRKYAHVHAKEKETVKPDYYGKKKAHFEKLANVRYQTSVGQQEHRDKFERRSAIQGLEINPLMEYVYGTNGVVAALQGNRREYFTRLLYHGSLPHEIEKLAKSHKIELVETDKHRLNLITKYAVHNNVALETKPLHPTEISHLQICNPETGTFQLSEMIFENEFKVQDVKYGNDENKKFPLGIYLDEVVDPHNVGAIIRSAYFLGADFIVMSRRNCAPLSPAVSKTSSGAVELMPIYYADKPLNFFAKSQEEGGWTFITSCLKEGSSKSTKHTVGKSMELSDLNGMCNKLPVMLVVGNEGDGVRTNLKMRSDFFVEIPKGRHVEKEGLHGPVDSLNVSVATAILLNNLIKNA